MDFATSYTVYCDYGFTVENGGTIDSAQDINLNVTQSEVTGLKYTMTGCEYGKTYIFRVTASNTEDESSYVQMSTLNKGFA